MAAYSGFGGAGFGSGSSSSGFGFGSTKKNQPNFDINQLMSQYGLDTSTGQPTTDQHPILHALGNVLTAGGHALDLINRPNYAVNDVLTNALNAAHGQASFDPLGEVMKGLTGQEKNGWGQTLQAAGMGEGPSFTIPLLNHQTSLRGVLGFLGDTFLNPINAISAGIPIGSLGGDAGALGRVFLNPEGQKALQGFVGDATKAFTAGHDVSSLSPELQNVMKTAGEYAANEGRAVNGLDVQRAANQSFFQSLPNHANPQSLIDQGGLKLLGKTVPGLSSQNVNQYGNALYNAVSSIPGVGKTAADLGKEVVQAPVTIKNALNPGAAAMDKGGAQAVGAAQIASAAKKDSYGLQQQLTDQFNAHLRSVLPAGMDFQKASHMVVDAAEDPHVYAALPQELKPLADRFASQLQEFRAQEAPMIKATGAAQDVSNYAPHVFQVSPENKQAVTNFLKSLGVKDVQEFAPPKGQANLSSNFMLHARNNDLTTSQIMEQALQQGLGDKLQRYGAGELLGIRGAQGQRALAQFQANNAMQSATKTLQDAGLMQNATPSRAMDAATSQASSVMQPDLGTQELLNKAVHEIINNPKDKSASLSLLLGNQADTVLKNIADKTNNMSPDQIRQVLSDALTGQVANAGAPDSSQFLADLAQESAKTPEQYIADNNSGLSAAAKVIQDTKSRLQELAKTNPGKLGAPTEPQVLKTAATGTASHVTPSAEESRYVDQLLNPQPAGKPASAMGKAFDAISRVYKTGMAFSPATMLRNVMGNVDIAKRIGNTSLSDMLQAAEGLTRNRGAEDTLLKTASGVPLTRDNPIVKSILNSGVNAGEVNPLKNGFNAVTKLYQGANGAFENPTRLGMLKSALDKGATPEQAVAMVNRVLGNFANQPALVKQINRVVPFFSWTAHNIPLQLEAMMKNPGKFTDIAALSNDSGFTPQEQAALPDYMKQGLYFKGGQSTDKNGNAITSVIRSIGAPEEDTLRLDRGGPLKTLEQEGLGALTPFLRVPLEEATNRDFYRGSDLNTEGGMMGPRANNFPDFLKKFVEYQQQTYKNSQGQQVTKPTVNPAMMKLLDLVPFTYQMQRLTPAGSTPGMNSDYAATVGRLESLPFRESPIDLAQQADYRQKDAAKAAIQYLTQKGILKQFTNTYDPNNTKKNKPF